MYYKRSDKFELKLFTDLDWARNIEDKKSTGGDAFFLGKRLVSWTRKKENCISQSTAQAGYVAAVVNCSNIMWITQLLKGMKEETTNLMVIYCDNTNAR